MIRATYCDASTADLLANLECWLWDQAELEADLERDPSSWDFPEQTRAFIDARIEALTTELQRRERVRNRAGTPRWPRSWRDHRPDAAEIKARLSCLDYLAARGVPLERRGQRWWTRCPLWDHEDRTPSFSVKADGALWYCHGCHRGGDLFTLWMMLNGCDDFTAAVADLAADAGLEAA